MELWGLLAVYMHCTNIPVKIPRLTIIARLKWKDDDDDDEQEIKKMKKRISTRYTPHQVIWFIWFLKITAWVKRLAKMCKKAGHINYVGWSREWRWCCLLAWCCWAANSNSKFSLLMIFLRLLCVVYDAPHCICLCCFLNVGKMLDRWRDHGKAVDPVNVTEIIRIPLAARLLLRNINWGRDDYAQTSTQSISLWSVSLTLLTIFHWKCFASLTLV